MCFAEGSNAQETHIFQTSWFPVLSEAKMEVVSQWEKPDGKFLTSYKQDAFSRADLIEGIRL